MVARTLLVLLCMSALSLSACGRKGDLLTPYEGQVEAAKEAEKAGQPATTPEPPVKDKRFILDSLID